MSWFKRTFQALLVLLCCLALAAPNSAQGRKQLSGPSKDHAKPTQPQVEQQPLIPGLRATLSSEPRAVEVGEPMTWTLEVHHPRELIPIMPGQDLGLGPHWVVLSELGEVTEASPDGIDEPGFWITRKRWDVICLASKKKLPSLEIFFGEGEGALSVLSSEGELVVKTVLGPGEQFARLSKGFRKVEGAANDEQPAWWMIASGVTLILAAGWWLFMRKRDSTSGPAKVAPLDQIAAMSQALPDDLQALQALHYELTALVREAADERLGLSLSGTTDSEWLDRVSGETQLGNETEQLLKQVIGAAESVKYARIQPSPWAVEETLKAARGALEALQQSGGGGS